jgi:hypothetical protein
MVAGVQALVLLDIEKLTTLFSLIDVLLKVFSSLNSYRMQQQQKPIMKDTRL